ncbi:MAG: hypothetical protein P8P74_05455 [Crocinitomicaceae bacterium]|nr:hypothetical protein [Crocinitomicaceae bacterium]
MKNIILKVPTTIFIVLVLLPFMILGLQIVADKELMEPKYYGVLSLVGSIVSSIWLFSIVDYFQSKAPDFKYGRLIYVLLSLDLILTLLSAFNITSFEGVIDFSLSISRLIIFIVAVIFIVLLVQKVFYERAVWFIVLEILIVIVGITTLTPEIKRNEKEF